MDISGQTKMLKNWKNQIGRNLSKKLVYNYFPVFHLFRNIKIQNRLIGSFLILSVLPLLITGVYSYNMSNQSIKSKISTYSGQIAHQINKEVNREISNLTDISENIVYSDYIQKNLSEYKNMDANTKVSMKNDFVSYLSAQVPALSSISEIRIVTESDDVMYYSRIYYMMSESMEKLKKATEANEGLPCFAPVNIESGHKGISMARGVYSVKTFQRIGYLFLSIDEENLSEIYRDIDLGKGADIFILDSNGIVVSSRNPAIDRNTPLKDLTIIKEISKYKKLKQDTVITTFEGKESLVAFSYIKNADWYVVCTIPFSYLNSESAQIGAYTALVGFICFLFAVALSVIITRSISTPLRRLVKKMNEAKKGNLEVAIIDSSRDEIGEVTHNFNDMIEEIRNLIISIRENERQKATEKLKALQAQINPHFLSNTLNTVKWLATVQNAENISSLVTSLIQLMHVSMGKGEELINISTEIDYIKNYITIQEYKYCDKFSVQYEIEDDILTCKIPQFTIQPIVENAIIHGIEPMEGQGIIFIKGARAEGSVFLTVTDNGVGFSEETLNGALDGVSHTIRKQFSGMGIKNVDERIKLMFGEQYGISVESVPNIYTKVKIRIPEVYENK